MRYLQGKDIFQLILQSFEATKRMASIPINTPIMINSEIISESYCQQIRYQ